MEVKKYCPSETLKTRVSILDVCYIRKREVPAFIFIDIVCPQNGNRPVNHALSLLTCFVQSKYMSAKLMRKGFMTKDLIAWWVLRWLLIGMNSKDIIIDLVGRVLANGLWDLGSIPGRVIPKTLKMVLDNCLLNSQQYKVRIQSKVEQSRERGSVFPYTSVL